MQINLTKPDDTIKSEFELLKSFEDIANLLEVPQQLLWKQVVGKKSYTNFKIPKKQKDEFREINKPSKNLDIIQKKLNYILRLVYTKLHNTAHGFTIDKSIKTNALSHINNKVVLNIDLEDFFGSINFARVRAMFMTYFKFNSEVATTLANICCDNNNVLAQGAATSPIISNIIANKLDKQLHRLAKSKRCVYTRYADDITFSTKLDDINKDILHDEINLVLGSVLSNIITSNGFTINNSKTRISRKNKAQYVTGIKINSKLNINRKYVKKIRTILNNIEKNINNLEEAKRLFYNKHTFRKTKLKDYDMFNIVRGMISHIGFVKGKNDKVFLKYGTRYNELIKQVNDKSGKTYAFINIPLSRKQFREQNVFVIESIAFMEYIAGVYKMQDLEAEQGTGFMLKDIGLITNWHVIKPYVEKVIKFDYTRFEDEYYIPVSKSRYEEGIWFAKIIAFDEVRDIAILEIEGIDKSKIGFNYSLEIESGMECCLLGYPEYKDGQYLHELEGKVQSARANVIPPTQFLRYTVNMSILGGNSGGPVVNNRNEVIAIAVKGRDFTVSEVIPIQELFNSIDNNDIIYVENHNIRRNSNVSV
ncbi:reverse transcriptase domain-containing protein [Lysinibacillus sp. FSL K6-4013]|uniref:reverse transcriptase domain-containing protein n=1 Tax=Lysinibacillus sp. FSL K6-4013 TaxID=2921504 RepID=UPI00315ACFB3